MSIRIKVFLIITVIILAITASSVIISITSAQGQIIKTLKSDMELVVSLANVYISGEIELLKANAASVLYVLGDTSDMQMQRTLEDQSIIYGEYFSAIAIFNEAGKRQHYREAAFDFAATEEVALSEYADRAFRGDTVISTTHLTGSGQPVFYIFVPMEDYTRRTILNEEISNRRIVILTVRGNYFSEKVNNFTIWETGHISMQDGQGTIIADIHNEWVSEQMNFIKKAEEGDNRYSDAARVMRKMISGEPDTDRYVLEDKDGVTAFMPIHDFENSTQGWSIAVFAPIAESPFFQVRTMIAIAGIIFLGLGMLAAAIASGVIAKPFYQVQKQNIQLTELGDALQAAQIAKTNFLANMSFDMRTPLNAVIGLSGLSLTKKEVPQDVRNYLDRIYESGITLMEVVNDLLDISNMDSGKFGVMPAEYDLPAFISETVQANKTHIGSKPITFKISPDEKLPARLVGDTLRIRQIFNNLLGNAFRHTSVGTVEWRISAEREGDTVWLVSSVSDTGVGIKPENIDKLFIDYNRLAADRERNLDGASGLGLTLTKRIADLMDGSIKVESTLGKGSVFTVRIRQKHVNDDIISAEDADNLRKFKYVEQKRIDNAGMKRVQLPDARVLVVDDVEINLEIAQGMIEPYGITVDCLSNGQEAVELVRLGDPRYDAIFMSRWMSQLDGKEAVRKIRGEIEGEYAKKVPIIALTTNTVIGNKDIFLNWGFQDVLSKPMDVLLLDKAIRRWVAGENVT